MNFYNICEDGINKVSIYEINKNKYKVNTNFSMIGIGWMNSIKLLTLKQHDLFLKSREKPPFHYLCII